MYNLRKYILFRFRNWNIVNIFKYSNLSCKVSKFFGRFLNLVAQNQMAILTLDRFLAARNPSIYRDCYMNNRNFPSRCTIANYVMTAILCLPTVFVFEINDQWERCLIDSTVHPLLRRFYFWLILAVFYTFIPLMSVLVMNMYIICKIRQVNFFWNLYVMFFYEINR